MHRIKGFTLLEVIIVMTLVGALTAVVALPYNNFVKNSRDARRKADMEQLRAALELFRTNNANASYPTAGEWTTSNTTNALVTGGYIKQLPLDPRTKQVITMTYTPNCDTSTTPVICRDYSLSTILESNSLYTITPSSSISISITPTTPPTTKPTTVPSATPTQVPACREVGQVCSLSLPCCKELLCQPASKGNLCVDPKAEEDEGSIGLPDT